MRDFSLTSATRHGADEMWAPFQKRAIPHFAINWGIAAFLTILWRCPKLLRSWGLTLLVSERAEFSFSFRKLEQLPQTNLAWQVKDVKEFQNWHALVVLLYPYQDPWGSFRWRDSRPWLSSFLFPTLYCFLWCWLQHCMPSGLRWNGKIQKTNLANDWGWSARALICLKRVDLLGKSYKWMSDNFFKIQIADIAPESLSSLQTPQVLPCRQISDSNSHFKKKPFSQHLRLRYGSIQICILGLLASASYTHAQQRMKDMKGPSNLPLVCLPFVPSWHHWPLHSELAWTQIDSRHDPLLHHRPY